MRRHPAFLILTILLLTAGGGWLAWVRHSPPPAQPTALRPETAPWIGFRNGEGLGGCVHSLATAYRIKWSQKAGSGFSASPVASDSLVVVADEDGQISALERSTGKIVWTHNEPGGVEATPLLVRPFVIVATLAGDIIAFQLQGGQEAWRVKTGEAIHGGPNLATVDGRPLVIVGGYDFQLRALEAGTGKAVWALKTENYINGTPAIDGEMGLAVFGGCDGWLRTAELATGREKAKMKADSYLPSSPAIHQGIAYAGSHGGILHAMSLAEGKALWSFQAPSDEPLLAPPAVNGDRVLLLSGRQRLVLEAATGRKLLEFQGRGKAIAAPVVDADKALVADEAGWITLSSLEDGRTLWEYELGPKITAAPAVAGRELFVADSQGNVHGLEALPPAP